MADQDSAALEDVSRYLRDKLRKLAADYNRKPPVVLSEFLRLHDARIPPSDTELDKRIKLVEQARFLFEQFYCNLPLKESLHAALPLRRFELLLLDLERLGELDGGDRAPSTALEFHNQMTEIFVSVRDIHMRYLLPEPYVDHCAFLGFEVESFFEPRSKTDPGKRRYLVSHVIKGFKHSTFGPGVEVLRWNGVPIEKAVERVADQHAGSNPEARHARGLTRLTLRPLWISLPPDEEWVTVNYRTSDRRHRVLQFRWFVVPPEKSLGSASDTDAAADSAADGSADEAMNVEGSEVGKMKRDFFARSPDAPDGEQAIITDLGKKSGLKKVILDGTVSHKGVDFGYLRIFTFDIPAGRLVSEFKRLVEHLPQNGLIIDVRDNSGGRIPAAERLLQMLTPRKIEPEVFQFLNTRTTSQLSQHDSEFADWNASIEQGRKAGALYSRGLPITTGHNDVGQVYHGPVVLITNASCYSATDMFVAGFRDHKIGKILGADDNLGAGGANAARHSQLLGRFRRFSDDQSSGFLPLHDRAEISVAFRRALRVGDESGTPLEDFGVEPDERHHMRREDLLYRNRALIRRAAGILAGQVVYNLTASVDKVEQIQGRLRLEVATRNIDRIDLYLVHDRRPAGGGEPWTAREPFGSEPLAAVAPRPGYSMLKSDGLDNHGDPKVVLEPKRPLPPSASAVEIEGYDAEGELVAARKVSLRIVKASANPNRLFLVPIP